MKTSLTLLLLAALLGCATPETPEQQAARARQRAADREANATRAAEREKEKAIKRQTEERERRERKATILGITSRYHTWAAGPSNATFFVICSETNRTYTPEFRHYAGHLEALLYERGWRVPSSDEKMDYMVSLNYSLVGSSERQDVRTVPRFGSTGGGTSYYSGWNYNTRNGPSFQSGYIHQAPRFGVTGYSTHVDTTTTFVWRLDVNIYDVALIRAGRENDCVFQGHVKVASDEPLSHARLLPGMMNALFSEFPGVSGGEVESKLKLANVRTPPVQPVADREAEGEEAFLKWADEHSNGGSFSGGGKDYTLSAAEVRTYREMTVQAVVTRLTRRLNWANEHSDGGSIDGQTFTGAEVRQMRVTLIARLKQLRPEWQWPDDSKSATPTPRGTIANPP